jgi:hypothetical protein
VADEGEFHRVTHIDQDGSAIGLQGGMSRDSGQ